MTYPPQPPGPGGWWPPPGQPGGWPTPQPGPPGQPGGQFPPSGPQQSYGNQPLPGPYWPGGTPPPPGYGPPPGPGLPGPQPGWGAGPRKRSPLPWILGGGGGLVVVLIIVVILFVTLGGGSPQTTAQKTVDILNSGNPQGLASVACRKDQPDIQKIRQTLDLSQNPDLPVSIRRSLQNVKAQFKLLSVAKDSSSHASATISLAWTNVPSDLPPEIEIALHKTQTLPPLDVIKENGDWKVCGLSDENSPSGQ
jgi:hypothetical protein